MYTPRAPTRNRLRMIAAVILLLPLIAMGGERELWALWRRHLGALDNHAGMISVCRKYAASLPQDPLLPVVRGIEAWHLLGQGKEAEATRVLSPLLAGGSTGLERGAQRLARGWMTRLQRKPLIEALQVYYRKEVRYPEKIEELASYPGLPGAEELPMNDAWGKRWRYRLVGFKGMPGFRDQKYTLQSANIQPPWDTAEAAALPYAKQINVRPSRVGARGVPGGFAVKLQFLDGENKGKTAVGQVGGTVEGLTVAYAGSDLVVLCDTLHWKILTWKR